MQVLQRDELLRSSENEHNYFFACKMALDGLFSPKLRAR